MLTNLCLIASFDCTFLGERESSVIKDIFVVAGVYHVSNAEGAEQEAGGFFLKPYQWLWHFFETGIVGSPMHDLLELSLQGLSFGISLNYISNIL